VADESIFWHDLNADGIVDEQDLAILTANSAVERRSPQTYVIGDINMDGTIDDEDMQAVIAHRNKTADWRIETATN